MSTHYIASVQIKRVDKVNTSSSTNSRHTTPAKIERTVTDLASFALKGGDLAKLKERVGAHIALVEEDGEIIDPEPTPGMRPAMTR